MSDGFLGEIRLFSTEAVPPGWVPCNGRLLPIRDNEALFSLLGTMYGGDGHTTFALPNLQGRLPVHVGGSMRVGQSGGELTHALTDAEMPPHAHQAMASANLAPIPTPPDPTLVLAQTSPVALYSTQPPSVAMSSAAVGPSGGSQPHPNMMPYLVLNFCIRVSGVYPIRG